jgi:two-component system, NtrC family, C4-dicarboxylate transport response regulator DctD
MNGQVIFVDDEEHLRNACSQALELAGFEVESHASAVLALNRIDSGWPGVLVTDVKMAGMTGLELMATTLERDPELPVILITGHGDVPMAVDAMRDGAYDFIEKPFASDILVDAVRRAADKRKLVMENRALRETLSGASRLEHMIVGNTAAAVALRNDVTNLATTDADVLIRGETGTGKELVARALHQLSPRADRNFVPINCAALPESIIESELFGHVRGAFTGANETRIGKFEHAGGGTLFLDEIESMPLDLQGRLLRVLEDRTVVRLGANEEIPVDVRVIAATKTDLKAESGTSFREDLFYRLNVLAIEVPPLRNRKDDILPLMMHFLDQAAVRFKRTPPDMRAQDIAELASHAWPGNVRELKNAAMRFALGQGFGMNDAVRLNGAGPADDEHLADQVAGFEKSVILNCLERHGYKLKPSYEELGVSRKTLYDKIKKYDLGHTTLDDS